MALRTSAAGILAACLLGTLGTLGSAGTASAAPADAELYAPAAATPGGASYRTWATRVFTWLQEVPKGRNPGVDADSPHNCDTRFGAVLLGPIGTGDGCVVPAGRPVVLAYLGWSCSTAEGGGRTFAELRRCAERAWRGELGDVGITMVVDGNRVREPRRWTVSSHDMWVDLPRHNVWDVRPGWTRSVGRGIFHVLKPPVAGEHVVRVVLVEDGERTVLRYPFTVQ